jgi:hypothetical protein
LLKSLLAWTLLTGAAFAADGEYNAITNTNAALRYAPTVTSGQAGTVPKGTALAVTVCFDEGAYCHVTSDAHEGYVAGELLTIEGDTNTVLTAEKARWELIRKSREPVADYRSDARNIVVWGDSLSYDTFGAELARLLPGREVSMQGVPGQSGQQISERMLADTRYTARFKIIWDRHWSGETPRQYLSELKPIIDRAAETGDFIILSDIRQIIASDKIDPATDKVTTDEINRELARLYPRNFLDVTALLDPPSMRASDGLHLSRAGYSAVAKALAQAIAARGSAVAPQ